MNILILGAAGFIGTNLAIELAKNDKDIITLVDKSEQYFYNIKSLGYKNVHTMESTFDENMNFDLILDNKDVVYHLVSSNEPTTSNQHITQDIQTNVVFSSNLFDACVRNHIKKIVFISSGGTVYGKESDCPLSEDTPTNPITSYGVQKITIEKLLYLYKYMYGLDYRIIRLSNPYGPYQRPNGTLGAVTTFTHKAINNEQIIVYGDGTIVRDFIYIDDAIKGIKNIVNGKGNYCTYNLGSGIGTSIKEVLETVKQVLNCELVVKYEPERKVDVPINFLDISRYEKDFGKLEPISLYDGIARTAKFMKESK